MIEKISNYFINDFLKFTGIRRKLFYKVLEKFKNKKIWNKNLKVLKNFNTV